MKEPFTENFNEALVLYAAFHVELELSSRGVTSNVTTSPDVNAIHESSLVFFSNSLFRNSYLRCSGCTAQKGSAYMWHRMYPKLSKEYRVQLLTVVYQMADTYPLRYSYGTPGRLEAEEQREKRHTTSSKSSSGAVPSTNSCTATKSSNQLQGWSLS